MFDSMPGSPKSLENIKKIEHEIPSHVLIDSAHEPDLVNMPDYAEAVKPVESSDPRNLKPEDFNNTDF